MIRTTVSNYIPLLLLIAAILLPNQAAAAEVWKWNNTVTKVKTFGSGAKHLACFVTTQFPSHVCFDLSEAGGKEKFSLILSARLTQVPISFSYIENSNNSALWFSNLTLRHLTLED